MNKVILIGRITKDLELRRTNSDLLYCKFTLAVNKAFKKNEADFINCVAWRKTAENLVKYCRKGSKIAVEGNIQTGSYTNKHGTRVYTTEVVAETIEFLDNVKKQQEHQDEYYNANNDYNQDDGASLYDFDNSQNIELMICHFE